jgi:hypothetical protein
MLLDLETRLPPLGDAPPKGSSARSLERSPRGFSSKRPDVDFRILLLLPAMLPMFQRPLGLAEK